ncbi:MAG TPA: hypothetical protein VIF43_03420 [Patescibacteria group bacterium]|jgi:hypothetical protein
MQTFKEIFAPSSKKVLAAVAVAFFAHLFISVSQIREATTATGGNLGQVREFWLTNLVNALPYLETDNTVLKFLTFFTVAYVLVWIISRLVELGTGAQLSVIKKLRKS